MYTAQLSVSKELLYLDSIYVKALTFYYVLCTCVDKYYSSNNSLLEIYNDIQMLTTF